MKPLAKLGILIISYENAWSIRECLESLKPARDLGAKILVVDNASTDATRAYVGAFEGVELLSSEENLGFAKGNNVGFERLKDAGVSHVLFLNPDTIVDEQAIQVLWESRADRRILQPLLLLFEDGKRGTRINSAGNPLNYLGVSVAGKLYEHQNVAGSEIQQVATVTGAAFLAPVSAFSDESPFCEEYFTYVEDTELSWRLRQRGYELLLVPESKVWHQYRATMSTRKLYFIERNRWYLLLTLWSFPLLLRSLLALSIHEVVSFAFLVKQKSGWAFFRSRFAVLAKLPWILRRRRYLRSKSVMQDAELRSYLSAGFESTELERSGGKVFQVYEAWVTWYGRNLLGLG